MKKICQKCNYERGWCICDLSILDEVGEVCAVVFLDNHLKTGPGAGSAFYQGWAYKHAQVKKLNHEKTLLIKENKDTEKMLRFCRERIHKLEGAITQHADESRHPHNRKLLIDCGMRLTAQTLYGEKY